MLLAPLLQACVDDPPAPEPWAIETTTTPGRDADRDGIPDVRELEDRTDPFDPRSARAWHPEIEGHPRLFLGPDEVETVAARVALVEGAHPKIWARIIARAGQTPPEQPTDGTYVPSAAVAQGEIAESAAFVGLLTGDAAMTAKAAALLAAPMPDPTYLNFESPFNVGEHYNLHESEALVGFCTAYDYLAGTDGVEAQTLADAREGLITRIDHFRTMCLGLGACRTLIRNEKNNHTLKPMGALGLCAMAVPDRPTAAEDFNEAVASLDWLFNLHQGEAEGGYGEGWNYLHYGGQSYVQLMYAMHRVAPGTTWRLRGLGTVTTPDPSAGRTADYVDFGRNPTTHGVFLGMLKAAQPDGRTVPIDDANPSSAPGGLLATLFDDPRFLWSWEQPAVNFATPRVATATFAALSPDAVAVPPDWPLDVFLPEAGFSVLRSDWGPDQLYVHVNHERGRMRTSGYSHEHADNLSIVVHAHGEPLIIDPGYIQFTEHLRVKYGHDHNLVLVDGSGPPYPPIDALAQTHPESDAHLHDWDDDPDFTTLIASTRYEDATLSRRVVRVDKRWLVVADALSDDEGGTRDWTWQINGYAGGTLAGTTYTADALGGTWERAAARVQVAVTPTVGTAAYDESLEDSQNVQGWRQHARRTAEATMGEGAGFLAVIAPSASDAAGFTLTAPATGSGVAALVVYDEEHDTTALWSLNLGDTDAQVTWEGGSFTAPPGLSWRTPEVTTPRVWSMDTPPVPPSAHGLTPARRGSH